MTKDIDCYDGICCDDCNECEFWKTFCEEGNDSTPTPEGDDGNGRTHEEVPE